MKMTIILAGIACAMLCATLPASAADYDVGDATFHVEENEWRPGLQGYAYTHRWRDPNVSHDSERNWEHLNPNIQPSIVGQGAMQGVAYDLNFATPFTDRATEGRISFDMLLPSFMPDAGWVVDRVIAVFEGKIPLGMPVEWANWETVVQDGNRYVSTRQFGAGSSLLLETGADGRASFWLEFGLAMTPPISREDFVLTLDRVSLYAILSPVPEPATSSLALAGLVVVAIGARRRRRMVPRK